MLRLRALLLSGLLWKIMAVCDVMLVTACSLRTQNSLKVDNYVHDEVVIVECGTNVSTQRRQEKSQDGTHNKLSGSIQPHRRVCSITEVF